MLAPTAVWQFGSRGTLTLLGSCAKSAGTVSIEEGAVACRPVSAWSGKYYSLKYYGDAALNRTNSGVAFAEFSLFGTDGKRVNQGTYAYTPLAVTEMASPANLKSWTVRVNGVERADLGVRWSNGVLRVSGGGLQVIFR